MNASKVFILLFVGTAIGCAIWLGFFHDWHDFDHQLSQEQRAAVYTGAAQRPKSKITLMILGHDCTHITKADIDGRTLLVYAKNDCHQSLDYTSWNWEMVSPDGTVIGSGMENWKCPTLRSPNSVAECHMDIKDDDRAVAVRIWTQKEAF